MDGVTTDPGTELLFENHRIRVWALTLDPGESSPMHRHLHDYTFVYVNRSEMEGHFPETDEKIPQRVDEGYVFYQEVGPDGGPPHRLTNVGTTRSTHYIFEFLGESASSRVGAREDNGRHLPAAQGAP
jgi:predicted metal-dependent enzyme (double-stranded beta helix superfamily)